MKEENERNEIKVNLSTYLLTIFLIIALVIIGIMGYYIYKLQTGKHYCDNCLEELQSSVSKIENVESKIKVISDTITEVTPEEDLDNVEIETLNNNDKLVKSLYKYVLKWDDCFSYFDSASFYKDKKVTYSSLSDDLKTLVVIKNYNKKDIEEVDKSTLKGVIDTKEWNDGKIVEVYSNIGEKSKEIFNETSDKWPDIDMLGSELKYKDDTYYRGKYYGGGLGNCESAYSEIQKVEKSGDKIYIYDKYIFFDETQLIVADKEKDQVVHIYKSSDKKSKNELGTFKNNITDKNTKQLYKKYKSKLHTYKHTFKKDEDGNYYWVSTEIAK